MKWIDTFEIAMALADTYPEYDPARINFVDLRDWVMRLPDFDDLPERCNEKILEAIQQAWLDEQ
ncbi:MAG: Fe-S cluster assembly protein IscX, partial [Zoogloeaceae bacterium]|nr:Fe-S cluster assembly protein IscX [Zoogloeaceae bacterium]